MTYLMAGTGTVVMAGGTVALITGRDAVPPHTWSVVGGTEVRSDGYVVAPRLEPWSSAWMLRDAAGRRVDTLGGKLRWVFPDASTAKAHLDKWRP